MKKLIALLLVAVMCLSFVACNSSLPPDSGAVPPNDNTTPPDSDGSQDTPSEKDFSVDLDGYVANIGNATALGIAQKQNDGATPVMAKGGIELLSFVKLSSNEDSESKNYIVMSTTEYDANTPEADKNGLSKVTFTKTITENVTTETTGTKYITASEGQITILAVTGFTYTIYENETLLYESVQDNDTTDASEQEGVIVLTDLIDGTKYKVDYQGIGEEITITQDEINGEIDKLYSTNNYTFISFVPEGMTGTLNGTLDYYGIDTYHKTEYVSHEMRQSFVIDNATGYIYVIENFKVDTILNCGLIQSENKYYKLTVNENGELLFTQFIQNTSLNIYGIFEDKFGQTFVYNDKLNVYDEENKTLYYTKRYYVLTEEGIAIYIKTYGDSFNPDYAGVFVDSDYDHLDHVETVRKIGDHMAYNDIEFFETYHLITPAANLSGELADHYYAYGEVNNGFLYLSCRSDNNTVCIDLSTMKYARSDIGVVNVGEIKRGWAFAANQAVIFENGNVYYGDIWGENSYKNGNLQNAKLLIANCGAVEEGERYFMEDARFIQITLTQTVYWKIIIDENGVPQAVNSETYIAPEKEVITLQPINK